MDANIKLGKIWGIPIGLNTSWFIIFGLLTWSLATGLFPDQYPGFSPAVRIMLGIVTSFLFFGSVLAHELGHAWVALRSRIPVRAINLFIFGGVAQITREPSSPGMEFRIAIAGPLVSLALAGLFGLVWLTGQQFEVLTAPGLYLMRINLLLALFNMIPGFPLDGGRVLRAIVWRLTRSRAQANRVAVLSGQLAAYGFIGVGIFSMISGQLLNGFWLAFIGWFLQNASRSYGAQMKMQQLLAGYKVHQVMTADVHSVDAQITISKLIEDGILAKGYRNFLVNQDGVVQGFLSVKDIMKTSQSSWRYLTVGQLMQPIYSAAQVSPGMDLVEALDVLNEHQAEHIPVVEAGELQGVLSLEAVLRFAKTVTEMRMQPRLRQGMTNGEPVH